MGPPLTCHWSIQEVNPRKVEVWNPPLTNHLSIYEVNPNKLQVWDPPDLPLVYV